MTHTYCMTSFSEELIHRPDSATTCPFFMGKRIAADGKASLH